MGGVEEWKGESVGERGRAKESVRVTFELESPKCPLASYRVEGKGLESGMGARERSDEGKE